MSEEIFFVPNMSKNGDSDIFPYYREAIKDIAPARVATSLQVCWDLVSKSSTANLILHLVNEEGMRTPFRTIPISDTSNVDNCVLVDLPSNSAFYKLCYRNIDCQYGILKVSIFYKPVRA